MATKINTISDFKYNRLSILLTQDGLSFLYLMDENHYENHYYAYEDKLNAAQESEALLKKELSKLENPEIQINLIYKNLDFNLSPVEFLELNKSSISHNQYNLPLQAIDSFSQDTSFNGNVVINFLPFINVNNYLFDNFGEFIHTHQASLYLKAAESYTSVFSDCICFVSDLQIDIVIAKQQHLELFNSFKISNEEDAIYYILYCLEVNQLDRKHIETIIVNFSDKLDLEKINQLIDPYIINLSIKDFSEKNLSNKHLSNHKFLNDLCE